MRKEVKNLMYNELYNLFKSSNLSLDDFQDEVVKAVNEIEEAETKEVSVVNLSWETLSHDILLPWLIKNSKCGDLIKAMSKEDQDTYLTESLRFLEDAAKVYDLFNSDDFVTKLTNFFNN